MEHDSSGQINRRKVMQTFGAASLTGLFGVASGKSTSDEAVQTENLGPAILTSQIGTALLVGSPDTGTEYVVSRRLNPAKLGVLDMESRTVTAAHDIPNEVDRRGGISYGMAATNGGDDLYIGMSPNADLYHFDPDSGQFSHATRFTSGDANFIMDVASTDGKVYAGTTRNSHVFEYDPATDAVRDYGPAVEGEQYGRSVAATPETLYVGVSTHAHLIAIDRETGDKQNILPSELSHLTRVTVAANDNWVAGATTGGAYGVLINRDDYSDYVTFHVEEEDHLLHCALDGSTVYAAGISGAIYKYEPDTDTVTNLVTPVLGDSNVGDLQFRDGEVVGGGVSGNIWTYDIDTAELTTTNIAAAGMPSSPGRAQSIGYTNGKVLVGGSWQTQVHDIAEGTNHGLQAPGEVKTMTQVKTDTVDAVYQGVYPGAYITKYESDELNQVANIGHQQYRPRDSYYDQRTNRLYVATRPIYGELGGALTTFNPETDEIEAVDRHIIQNASIESITSIPGELYLGTSIYGGAGTDSGLTEGKLVAWDPTRREKKWQLAPVPDANSIRHLVTDERKVFGITGSGTFFVVDPKQQSVVRTRDVPSNGGELVYRHNRVYIPAKDGLYEFDPTTGEFTELLDGLNGGWYNEAQLAATEHRDMYTLMNRDLLQASVTPRN